MMMRSRSCCVVVLALVVATGACKKEDGRTTNPALPAEMQPPAAADVRDLPVPGLFASVPADTPYLFGSLEAIPIAYFTKLQQAFGPIFEDLRRKGQAKAEADDSPDSRLGHALLDELAGKWSKAGLESLGLSAEPRFAIYGLGLQPVVVRVEVRDPRVLQATIERIAARGGAKLPPQLTKNGRGYWKVGDDEATAIFALADGQLIAAVGKPADVEANLGVILGLEKPARSMADGKLIKELMTRHGFGPIMLGMADTRRIATAAFEATRGTPSPACGAEIARLSTGLPRFVFGHSEFTASRATGGLVVELSPDAVAQLQPVRTAIPGLAAALAEQPLLALAAGLDLVKAQKVAIAVASQLQRFGAACALSELAEGAGTAAREMSGPLPGPVTQIAGGVATIHHIEMDRQRPKLPSKLEGFAAIASPDARGLFDQLAGLLPQLKDFGITPDGKLHAARLPAPFPVYAGVGDRAIVAVVGDRHKALGEQAITAPSTPSPLLAMSYDLAKVLALEAVQAGIPTDDVDGIRAASIERMLALFGRIWMTIDVTRNGLAFWGGVELR